MQPANRLALIDQDLGSSPRMPVPVASGAFMVCPLLVSPVGGVPALWQQVYQAALEQARAASRPSRWEGIFAPSRN
jgi:hypothetical protein